MAYSWIKQPRCEQEILAAACECTGKALCKPLAGMPILRFRVSLLSRICSVKTTPDCNKLIKNPLRRQQDQTGKGFLYLRAGSCCAARNRTITEIGGSSWAVLSTSPVHRPLGRFISGDELRRASISHVVGMLFALHHRPLLPTRVIAAEAIAHEPQYQGLSRADQTGCLSTSLRHQL